MERIEQYVAGGLRAVSPALYGEIVASITAAGASANDAEIMADAVLGPLRLVPPPDEVPQWLWEDRDDEKSEDDFCLARYFTSQGEWKWCGEEPGHEEVKKHYAFNPDDRLSWDDHDLRAIPRDYA
ncbi:hypothetical protein ACIOHC_36175 [Streptomyces sp. NPDC088252]|uniref:hypothetical protein n=1 Tax=Streptomyces sp. NPDC088252 TaxID=3365845 RepID=UPI00380CCCBC